MRKSNLTKKITCVLMVIVLCTTTLSSCSQGQSSDEGTKPSMEASPEASDSTIAPTDETEPTTESESTPEAEFTPETEPTVGTESTPDTEPTADSESESTTIHDELPYNVADGQAVYFTADITPEGLVKVYQALEANPKGKIAVKLSTGEPPNSNYLRPELIKDLVQSLNGTIVECNTAYGGSRSSNRMHRQVVKDHGFTDIAKVDIMDAKGEISLPVNDGEILEENFVGSHFKNYDYYVVLSHFKGHAMAGYGGAIKNISIGIASSGGKLWIHNGGTSKTSGLFGDQTTFLKGMAEAGKSVVDHLEGNILYVNVMNRLSIDCDCDGNPAEPDMHDVGVLASFDPVALDQACIDLVETNPDGASLMNRIQSLDGLTTLEHAASIGLGSREYSLVNVDG